MRSTTSLSVTARFSESAFVSARATKAATASGVRSTRVRMRFGDAIGDLQLTVGEMLTDESKEKAFRPASHIGKARSAAKRERRSPIATGHSRGSGVQ